MHLPTTFQRRADSMELSRRSTELIPGIKWSALFPYSAGLEGVDQGSNYRYVHITVFILLVALLLTLCLRIARQTQAHFRHLSIMGRSTNSQAYWAENKSLWWPWLKRWVLYAPIWKFRHNREMQLSKAINMGTLPGRGHFVLLVVYTACNIAWTLALPYHKSSQEIVAALRGRAGVIAVFNLFPTIVFALRNNPFIYLLKVPFDTFNLFHRWAGRIFVIEALLHLCAWATNTVRAGGWGSVGDGLWRGDHAASFSWGMAAACTAFIILIQAWSPLRHAFYEAFLWLHKILAFATFLGTFFHLKIDNLPQLFWMCLIFAIWAYEYICRIYRILKYNVNLKNRQFSSRVTIEALPGEACRVTFHLTNSWKPKPGCHVHAYFPALAPFTSHPFSVAWADSLGMPSPDSYKTDKDTGDMPLSAPQIRAYLDRSSQYQTDVCLLVRARTGFTRFLYNKASEQPNGIINTWGFCEGFYGGQDSLNSYGEVMLFAGGVGITHQIMHTKQLLEAYAAGINGIKRINLIWSIPDGNSLEWIRPWMDQVLRMPGRRDVLRIKLYITRPNNPRDITSNSGSVAMYPGRCHPQDLIDEAVLEKRGAIAVTVCGPGAFADGVRDAARKRVQHAVVDFIEEAFTY